MSKRLKLPTLLVITENPTIRFWVKKHLDSQFFIIDAAKRSAALDAVKFAPLDFIILDSKLEDCNPLQLCKELRQMLHITPTPILLVTGKLKKSYREEALEAGVTDFLSSQLDFEELETRIATLRKAAEIRQKTTDLSAAIQTPRRELSENYLRDKFLLHDKALRLLAQGKKEGVSMTLLVLRIDNFEELQSRFGHSIAETILLPFSNLLNRHLRDRDLLIPSAEGKFIILLSNVSKEQTHAFAETLRKEIQQHNFPTQKGPIQLTVSIAFSSLEANESAFNQMIRTATKALHQAETTENMIISLEEEG